MQRAGKEVSIGEGSAAAPNFNVRGATIFRTRKREILDPMQRYVFEQLGYADLAKTLHVPLINLHSGELVEVAVPGGFVFDKITLHKCLTEIDMLCSVPMMKTHQLATVTLGMKNLIGTFPGTIYQINPCADTCTIWPPRWNPQPPPPWWWIWCGRTSSAWW
jgi:desulfoferrodoxin (superoxide reductase-like protein)